MQMEFYLINREYINMLKKTMLASSLAILSVVMINAHAIDGTINFTGEVVTAPCVVATDSINQHINMGQVKTSALVKKGSKSRPTPFQINLEECDTTTLKTANVTFAGVSDSLDKTVLSITPDAGSARNVGIEISTGEGTKVPLNTPSSDFALKAGQNIMRFQSAYIATADFATAGHANGIADFTVDYK
ncbi:S-fimbrillin [Serratia quinivorans]|uniref:fimbrial protein n=1 Tax=Serratia quinivorans TaxID=137545 RepID=UPI002177F01D|nr:fimbrial protein [Serratia quinivorans]CAI1604115.1 S-fimbrillin [Serratia quinivorans]